MQLSKDEIQNLSDLLQSLEPENQLIGLQILGEHPSAVDSVWPELVLLNLFADKELSEKAAVYLNGEFGEEEVAKRLYPFKIWNILDDIWEHANSEQPELFENTLTNLLNAFERVWDDFSPLFAKNPRALVAITTLEDLASYQAYETASAQFEKYFQFAHTNATGKDLDTTTLTLANFYLYDNKLTSAQKGPKVVPLFEGLMDQYPQQAGQYIEWVEHLEENDPMLGEGVRLCGKAIQLNPHNTRLPFILVRALQKLPNTEQRVFDLLESELDKRPNNYSLLTELVDHAWNYAQNAEIAERYCWQALESQRTTAVFWGFLGEIYDEHHQDYSKAAEYYQNCIENEVRVFGRTEVSCYYPIRLALLHFRNEQQEKAIQAYHEAYLREPWGEFEQNEFLTEPEKNYLISISPSLEKHYKEWKKSQD